MSSVHQITEADYWIDALDEATRIMAVAHRHPVDECLEPVVPIAAGAEAAGVRIVCLATPHPSGRARDHRVRRSVLRPLLKAAAEFADQGYMLVVEDALRTVDAQRETAASPVIVATLAGVLAQADPDATDEQLVARLAAIVAATPKTAGHVAGAAVDITVRDADGQALDRGGPYLDLSARMPMASPFLTEEQRDVRAFITGVMARSGLVAYPAEFWHYSRGDSLAAAALGTVEPAVYGPVRVAPDGQVTPVEDVDAPLNRPETLVTAIREALR
jgi:D-alanyl-D-alanine dipeptidase